MADYYLNLALGSGGTGTANDPFGSGTVSGWGVTLASNDRILVWGTGTANYITLGSLSGKTGLRLVQYEGRAQSFVDGATRMTAWSNATGNVWTPSNNIPGSKPGGIIYDRAETLQSDGSYMPWLPEDTGAAVPGDVGVGKWAWLSNTLYVHAPGGVDPTSHDVAWAPPLNSVTGGGVSASAAVGLLVEGIWCAHFPGNTPDTGYGINIDGGTDCIIRGCQTWDTGNKGLGVHGTSCANILIDQCRMHAIDGGPLVILHSTSGAISGRVTNCYGVTRTRAYRDGTPATSNNCQFGLSHGAGGVSSVQYDGCTWVGKSGFPGGGISTTDNYVASPAAVNDWTAYPFRVRNCIGTNLSSQGSIQTPTAWVGCKLDFRNAPSVSGNGTIITVGDSATANVAGPHSYLFEGCSLSFDGNHPTENTTRLMNLYNDCRYRFNGCTILEYGANTQGTIHPFLRFHQNSSTAVVIARRTIWAHRVADASKNWLLHSPATTPPTTAYDFADCWYYNIGTGQYSRTTNRTTQANWSANVDATGVYEVDPGFADASTGDTRAANTGQLARRNLYATGIAHRRDYRRRLIGYAYGGVATGTFSPRRKEPEL